MVGLGYAIFSVCDVVATEKLPQQKENIKLDYARERAEQIVHKYAGSGAMYVYNQDSGNGVWIGKELIKVSFPLQQAMNISSENKDRYASVPVQAHERTIKNLFDVLVCPEPQSEKKCLNVLSEKMEKLNFSDVLSTFVLADYLIDDKELLKVFISKINNSINHESQNEIVLHKGDFISLQRISADWHKAIFSDDNFKVLLESIKKNIIDYCFNYRFSKPVFYSMNSLLTKINYLSFNADKSRLLYVGLPHNIKNSYYLFEIDVKTSDQYFSPKVLHLFPCWINENTYVYIEFGNTSRGKNNKLIVYDCVKRKSLSERVIYPDYDKEEGHDNFEILELLYDNSKIIFLYHYGFDYGIGLFDPSFEGAIAYKKLNFANSIKLLSIQNNSVVCLDYDHDDNRSLSLYKAPLDYDLEAEKYLITDFSLSQKHSIALDSKEEFSKAVMNDNKSKVAFVTQGIISIQSLINVVEKPVICKGAEGILSIAFSPDDTTLMVGCSGGKIIVFDIKTGSKIGELLSQEKRAFNENYAVALSDDGAMFCAGGDTRESNPLVMELKQDWKIKQDTYLSLLSKLESYSFDKKVFLKILNNRLSSKKKSIILTDSEKEIFHSFDTDIQEMLITIGYGTGLVEKYAQEILEEGSFGSEFQKLNKSGQELQMEAKPGVIINTDQPDTNNSNQASFLQRLWNAGGYYWNAFKGKLPRLG